MKAYNNNIAKNIDLWVIDSGATSHMTPHIELLSDYEAYNEPKNVFMGTGRTTKALGQGLVLYDAKHSSGKLKKVIYVPKLEDNLLSLNSWPTAIK